MISQLGLNAGKLLVSTNEWTFFAERKKLFKLLVKRSWLCENETLKCTKELVYV